MAQTSGRPKPETMDGPAGHGSPAGEPLPGDKSSTTTAPVPVTPAAGDAATLNPNAGATQDPEPSGAGPSSRDTPPPVGLVSQAGRADEQSQPPKRSRPPRPLAATQGEHVPETTHAPPSPDNEALVEAITRRLAENLAKALRQSVVEAVEGVVGAPRPPGPGDATAKPAPPPPDDLVEASADA